MIAVFNISLGLEDNRKSVYICLSLKSYIIGGPDGIRLARAYHSIIE